MSNDKKLILLSLGVIALVSGFFIIQIINKKDVNNSTDDIAKSKIPTELDFGKGTKDLIIDQDTTLDPGTHEYNSFTVNKGALKLANAGKLEIKSKTRIVIEEVGFIDIREMGYGQNTGPLLGLSREYSGDGGGGYYNGGVSGCTNTLEKKELENFDMGSGGGIDLKSNESKGGIGGGYLILSAPEIIIKGKILADGGNGKNAGGGGGGGTVIILGNKISVTGSISVKGGNGANGNFYGGGGGSGGVVGFSKEPEKDGEYSIDGGRGGQAADLYAGCSGRNGLSGVVIKP